MQALRLTKPEKLPAVNECILCTRCGATYRVLAVLFDGVQLWPSQDPESAAHATMPWCPGCGTAEERRRGATFSRGAPPTWVQLRAALKEALDGWEADEEIKRGPANGAERVRIAELRKMVEP